jgi:hypothetical protein
MMVRFNALRRVVVLVAGMAGAALLWASVPGLAPLGQAVHAASRTQVTVAQALVGTWLGPAIADTGRCGLEYGQWTFFQNHEYSYTMNSDYQEIMNPQGQITRINDCGGITNAGYYVVRGNFIIFFGRELTYPYARFTVSAGFRFYNINTLIIFADRAYIYHRQ